MVDPEAKSASRLGIVQARQRDSTLKFPPPRSFCHCGIPAILTEYSTTSPDSIVPIIGLVQAFALIMKGIKVDLYFIVIFLGAIVDIECEVEVLLVMFDEYLHLAICH